jgi:hypothetical protein
MRHLIVVSCTLFIFVLSFSAIYIFFRASAPHIRGLMGGGFFLLASLLLLGKDFASVTFTKRVL